MATGRFGHFGPLELNFSVMDLFDGLKAEIRSLRASCFSFLMVVTRIMIRNHDNRSCGERITIGLGIGVIITDLTTNNTL